MSLSQSQQLFARDTIRLFQFIEDNNHSFTYGDAYRAPELAKIYAAEGKGIVDSLHCKRLAIDINLFNEKCEYITDFKEIEFFGKFWESLNPANRWGGNFKHLVDSNHFERNGIV
jgi:D-alanyl-D-alanine carboxypeptidase